MNVTIYTDGSCTNNGKPEASAGWSVVIKGGSINEELYGKLPGDVQTNNRAELFAIQKALEWVKNHPGVEATICSDSKLAIDGMIGRSSRKANRDIWEEIEKLAVEVNHKIRDVQYIPRKKNKRADELAKMASKALFCAKNNTL